MTFDAPTPQCSFRTGIESMLPPSATARVVRRSGRRVVALFVVLAQFAWPCEEIAMLSTDAKYMLLDGDTLRPVDVGNLRWAGVWGVDRVVAGSTAERLAFVTDDIRVEGGRGDGWRLIGAAPAASDRLSVEAARRGGGRDPALVVAANLSEEDPEGCDYMACRSGSPDLSFTREYDLAAGGARWIDGTDELLVWQRAGSVLSLSVLAFEGYARLKTLGRVDEWTMSNEGASALAACRDEGRLFVGGDDFRVVRADGASAVAPLARPAGAEDCWMEGPSAGCRASLRCRGDGRYMRAVVDLASNRVVSSARLAEPALAGVALFADGRKLLGQLRPGPKAPGVLDPGRGRPGAQLRVLDATSGDVLAETDVVPPVEASGVFCAGNDARVVLSERRRVRLVDLKTLVQTASAAVPFDRHFAF